MEKSSSGRGRTASKESRSEHSIQTDILLKFGAQPWLRIWRVNTGKAYGYSTVKAALDHMLRGRWQTGLELLKHAQLITFGTPGQADIQGVMASGTFVGIEVKKPGEEQSPEQVAWQAMVERMGGLYILAFSTYDVIDAFARQGYRVEG